MADGIEFHLDTSGFENALVRYMEYSKRTVPEIVNKSAVDVIIKAAQYTTKAAPANIQKALYSVEQITVSPKTGRDLKKARAQVIPSRLVYRIINARLRKQGKPELTGASMSEAAQKLIKARRRSIGYIAYAGWQRALLDLGGRGFGSGKTGKLNPRSHAARGHGRKAEWMRPAIFSNTAVGANKIGSGALQQSLNERVKDMLEEVARRMKAAAR